MEEIKTAEEVENNKEKKKEKLLIAIVTTLFLSLILVGSLLAYFVFNQNKKNQANLSIAVKNNQPLVCISNQNKSIKLEKYEESMDFIVNNETKEVFKKELCSPFK